MQPVTTWPSTAATPIMRQRRRSGPRPGLRFIVSLHFTKPNARFIPFDLSNPWPRSYSSRFKDHGQADGAPPRADADSGVQLQNQQPQGQHLLELREPQVCLTEMLGFCEFMPGVFSEWGLCPRLEGVEQATNSAPYGGVSVSSTLALNLTSQHHKQRLICQAYSPVLEDSANTFFQLDVRCESVNGSFISSFLSCFLAFSWCDQEPRCVSAFHNNDLGLVEVLFLFIYLQK